MVARLCCVGAGVAVYAILVRFALMYMMPMEAYMETAVGFAIMRMVWCGVMFPAAAVCIFALVTLAVVGIIDFIIGDLPDENPPCNH